MKEEDLVNALGTHRGNRRLVELAGKHPGGGSIDPNWPAATIPVFISMMFGATLGGNATLIGASANVVAAGVCAREGRPVSFVGWLRYGLPVTLAQLAVGALYVLAMFQIVH